MRVSDYVCLYCDAIFTTSRKIEKCRVCGGKNIVRLSPIAAAAWRYATEFSKGSRTMVSDETPPSLRPYAGAFFGTKIYSQHGGGATIEGMNVGFYDCEFDVAGDAITLTDAGLDFKNLTIK